VRRIKHFDWEVFQYKNHSQNSYASKSLQFYAKWINMNWKLITKQTNKNKSIKSYDDIHDAEC
jgi:hypothetical protein